MASPNAVQSLDVESGTNADSKLLSAREAERANERKRAEEHRRAGKEWFDRAMQASSQRVDPFHPLQQKGGPNTDQDFAAFGAAFNRVKVHVYVSVLITMLAAQPILVKNSLRSMRAPAVLVFLHHLSAALTLWAASHYDLPTQLLQIDKLQLNMQGVKGAAVPAALASLQMLCMFSALHHTSVLLVLGWMAVGEQVIDAGTGFVLTGQLPAPDMQKYLSVAVGALVLDFLWEGRSLLGLIMLLLWGVLKVAEVIWKHLKADPHLGGRIASFYVAGLVREFSDEGEALKAPTLAFLSNVLAAGPVLLLGFLGLEGRELASHEPSVPAVSAMLLACGCHVLITCAALLLERRLQAQSKQQHVIKAGAAAGTIILMFMVEEPRSLSFFAVLCTAVAAGAAMSIQLRTKTAGTHQQPYHGSISS